MRTIVSAFIVSAALSANPAIAGAGHEHGPGGTHSHGPIAATAVIKKAEEQVGSLVARGKLDKSWSGIKAADATQKDVGKGAEWVVTFRNEKAEPDKRTLYVFYTLTGKYMATNFTGK